MKAADLQVKSALIRAGYEGRPMDCRGALYEILKQLLREDPRGNDDLVDGLRSILSEAAEREGLAELESARLHHPFVRACPECGQKPDVEPVHRSSTGEVVVICPSCMTLEDGVVMQGGKTLVDAIERWNSGGWASSASERKLFSL
ncbi:hypothetical protein JH25_27955 [Pseudomonas sp. BRG-100]|uniref:hypothetical protein n=1 Tax=Pseudomonas sp. BRG-100 TaxID=1524267 RepID=UPI0004E7A18B|nr:hypothetical protein [Pseudomonas sp. BRG-100]KFF42200.1 hypothetical protein JH25_27955 [Pseudomonas sp. BRG-100]